MFLALELTVCKNRYFYTYVIEIHGEWVLCKTLKDPKAFFDIKKHQISFFGKFKINFLITIKFSIYCNFIC